MHFPVPRFRQSLLGGGLRVGKPLVINVQKYSIHDGPGIRTTFFFKGCPLSCAWCHNPESQSFSRELLYRAEDCRLCGACAQMCPAGAVVMGEGGAETDRRLCAACGACVDACAYNARSCAGEAYRVEELVRLAEQDRMFYETSGGGVTLSGGEVMAQDPDFLEALVRALHRKGCAVAVDTCGEAPYERFARILPYVDLFLYDLKLMDPQRHERYMGRPNGRILDNLRALSRDGAGILLRLPLVEGVNSGDGDIGAILAFLNEGIRVKGIHLLPYHDTGRDKYERLGRPYGGGSFRPPAPERLEQIARAFLAAGYGHVKLGG